MNEDSEIRPQSSLILIGDEKNRQAMDINRKHTYISHAHTDATMAGELASLLQGALNLHSEQIRCDSSYQFKSVGSDRIPVGIARDVESASAFICLCSSNSSQSEWVMGETAIASRLGDDGKHIIPVGAGKANQNFCSPFIRERLYYDLLDVGRVKELLRYFAGLMGLERDDDEKKFDRLVHEFVRRVRQIDEGSINGRLSAALNEISFFKKLAVAHGVLLAVLVIAAIVFLYKIRTDISNHEERLDYAYSKHSEKIEDAIARHENRSTFLLTKEPGTDYFSGEWYGGGEDITIAGIEPNPKFTYTAHVSISRVEGGDLLSLNGHYSATDQATGQVYERNIDGTGVYQGSSATLTYSALIDGKRNGLGTFYLHFNSIGEAKGYFLTKRLRSGDVGLGILTMKKGGQVAPKVENNGQ